MEHNHLNIDHTTNRQQIAMNIQQLRDSLPKAAEADPQPLHYVHGTIELQNDGRFRIYLNPNNRFAYWILDEQTIGGDIAEWPQEAVAHKGLVGHRVFTLPVKTGSEVLAVQMTRHKLGETVSAEYALDAKSGVCRSSSGCGTRPCCTTSGTGCSCNTCCVGKDA